MRLLLLAAVAYGDEPVTLAYRSTDTLSRTTGTRISRTGRYAWLDHEKWAAYAKELYGPNNATIDHGRRWIGPCSRPIYRRRRAAVPRSDDEPFKRFNWHAPFSRFRYFRRRTARDPPPPAFRNFSRIEVTHCGGSKFETNGAFFYAFRGTGLYIDIGRSLAFETHDDASRYLLGKPCAPGKPPDMKLGIFQCDAELPRIIGAAKSKGGTRSSSRATATPLHGALSARSLAKGPGARAGPLDVHEHERRAVRADPRSQLCGCGVVLTKGRGHGRAPPAWSPSGAGAAMNGAPATRLAYGASGALRRVRGPLTHAGT